MGELRVDLPTLYAAADGAAASFAGLGALAAAPRAVLRCLLQQSMRRVSDRETELHRVRFETLQGALRQAAAASDELRGFDPNGPALPALLGRLAAAGFIDWPGGPGSGPEPFAALRADRLLHALRQQRTAAPAAAARSAPPPPSAGSDHGSARAVHPMRHVLRTPAAFSALHMTEHSCSIKLDLSASPSGQAQRSCAMSWLEAAIEAAVPGGSAAAWVQREALRTLLSSLAKSGSWAFKAVSVDQAQAAAELERALAGFPGPAGCFWERYRSDLLRVLREPACSHLVQLPPAKGLPRLLLRIDRLAQSFIAAAGQPGGPAWEAGEPAQPARTPQPAARPPRTAAMPPGMSARAAGSPEQLASKGHKAAAKQRPAQMRLVADEQAALAAVAELQDASELALACLPAASNSSGSSGHHSSSSSGEAPGLSAVVLSAPGGSCVAFDLQAGGERVASQLAALLEREQTTKVVHDGRGACAALFREHGIRCASLWDTQARGLVPAWEAAVAYGVLQLICGLGSPGGAEAAVDPPASLAALLRQYGLRGAGQLRDAEEGPEADPGQLMKSAVAAAGQLPALKAQLEADLGPAASMRVEHLSRAWAEWRLPAAQRSYAAAKGGVEAGAGGGEADERAAEGGEEQLEAWLARLLERAALYE